jgi:hypothetical protein
MLEVRPAGPLSTANASQPLWLGREAHVRMRRFGQRAPGGDRRTRLTQPKRLSCVEFNHRQFVGSYR